MLTAEVSEEEIRNGVNKGRCWTRKNLESEGLNKKILCGMDEKICHPLQFTNVQF